MKLILAPAAERNLDEITQYIARDSVDAAVKVWMRLRSAMRELARFPGKGHRRDDVARAQYRFWKVYSYLIVYRFDGAEVTVVRIVHGSRDLKRSPREL